MAYNASAFTLKFAGIGGQAPQTWVHSSADATGAVDAAAFFTGIAPAKSPGFYGVKVGDIVEHTDTTNAGAYVTTKHSVNSVDATTGVINVSVGVVIGTGGTSGD